MLDKIIQATTYLLFYIHAILSLDETLETQNLLFARKWQNHKTKYQLNFISSEEVYRIGVYRDNFEFISLFNEENHTFTLGENKFTHWTHQEYLNWLLSVNNIDGKGQKDIIILKDEILNGPASDKDWRSDNKVTAVKDQGSCGGCYAFASTAAVESAVAIKSSVLRDLSPQEIIDCSESFGNKGCKGGSVSNSFKYMRERGVVSNNDYPYKTSKEKCYRDNLPKANFTKISGLVTLTTNDEAELASAVSKIGPVAVSVDASAKTFMMYKSGVYYDAVCSSSLVNHGMVVVGIDSKPSQNYILKNSWGKSWGESGFMKLARNKENHCGIARSAIYPTV